MRIEIKHRWSTSHRRYVPQQAGMSPICIEGLRTWLEESPIGDRFPRRAIPRRLWVCLSDEWRDYDHATAYVRTARGFCELVGADCWLDLCSRLRNRYANRFPETTNSIFLWIEWEDS